MGWKDPARLSSSQAFLTFLIEQEIHYPSVKHRSGHSVWNCLLTVLTGAFVCAVDTKLAQRCCKTTDNIRLPSSGINTEAGAPMEQSAWGAGGAVSVCVVVCGVGWGNHVATNTQVRPHIRDDRQQQGVSADSSESLLHTAVAMFSER